MNSAFIDWFWNEKFWLPVNTTWAALKNREDATFAQAADLWLMYPYALLVYGVRLFIERFVARPIGRWLELSDTPNKRPPSNAILEKVFESQTKYPDKEKLKGLCKQVDWSEHKILIWFHHKRELHRPSQLTKFSETVWRFIFYIFAFTLGVLANFQTKCPIDTRTCWIGYPEQPRLNFFSYWYYQTELAFYTSCAISQFFDIKRKDFWIMFTHHVATILLIIFSYSVNMINIGMIIMLIHDFSDVFLEASKIAKYTNYESLATAGLIFFAASFVFARLVYFPFWILYSLFVDAFDVVGAFPSWYFFCAWLTILLALHIYWSKFIIIGFVKFFKKGGYADDARSESEASITDDGEAEPVKPKLDTNGVTSPKCRY